MKRIKISIKYIKVPGKFQPPRKNICKSIEINAITNGAPKKIEKDKILVENISIYVKTPGASREVGLCLKTSLSLNSPYISALTRFSYFFEENNTLSLRIIGISLTNI